MTLLAAIGDDAWLTLIGLIALLAIYLLIRLQRTWLIDPTIKQMRELHLKRCARARLALQGPAGSDWEAPSPDPGFSFKHWVELSPTDGTVRVAGQNFITSQTFEVVARDDDGHNIPHARVNCDGRGNVLITSHGKVFRARYVGDQWDVKILPPNETGSR
jgi:hypothetical protein